MRRACALTVLAATGAALAGTAHAASPTASSAKACQTVHIGPARVPGAPPSSYFQLSIRPGAVVGAAVIAANPARRPCAVTLLPAYGQTAVNSGNTYPVVGRGRRCVEASCWVSGLPKTVTVPAGRRIRVPFTVAVPETAGPGQYLAGVVGQPHGARRTLRLSGSTPQIGASVLTRVAIGIAVTVPGRLRPHLSIPSVELDTANPSPVLLVTVHNDGTTWEHPVGGARIRTGDRTRSYGLRSSTVLAGDRATIPLPVRGISRGGQPTEVVLWYDNHRQKAVWRGTIAYPTPPKVEAGPGGRTIVAAPAAPATLPLWVKIVIVVLAIVVFALLALLLVQHRRRRRDGDEEPAEVAALLPVAESAHAEDAQAA